MSNSYTTLVTPEILADQYPVIAELRESDPVFYDETMQAWLIFRHEDVKALLTDSRYSRDRKLSPHYEAPHKGSWSERLDNESFGGGNEEDHRLWRNRFGHALVADELFLLVWQGVALKEQIFGAEESHALGSAFKHGDRVSDLFHIG